MKQLREELWMQTPCTIPFVSASNSFNKTERFKLFSIYHKDDVNKPKPVFNDIEKPELLLQQFRREIQEASSDRFKRLNLINRRHSERLPTPRNRSKQKRSDSPDKLITDKLYKLKEKQDGRYDRYGNRCNLNAQPEDLSSQNPSEYSSEIDNSKNKVSFWTSSHRIDLSRPLNFYPAPNSYRHIDFLSERKWVPVPGRSKSLMSGRTSRGSDMLNRETVEAR